MTRAKSKAPIPTLEGDWMSSKDVCLYLDICYPTLKKLIDGKRLVGMQYVPGGKYWVSVPSIRKLIESSQTTAPES
jgi:hypothetical protein